MGKIFTFLVSTPNRKPIAERVLRNMGHGELLCANSKGALPHVDMRERVFVRWGSPYDTEHIHESITYNSRASTRQAYDKRSTRALLRDAGIQVPRSVSPGVTDIRYPVIARPRRHGRAENFVLLESLESFRKHYYANIQNWYYSEFVDKIKEFRVHVAHGKVLGVLEKTKCEGIIWNTSFMGTANRLLYAYEWDINVVKTAVKTLGAVGMDFTGIDIMVDGQGEAYVLECNAMPNIVRSGRIFKRYMSYFKWLASSGERRPHFKIDSDDPKDYAWEVEKKKKLTILVPSMYIHSAMEIIFPKLRSKDKEFVVGTDKQEVAPHIDMNDRIFIRWRSMYNTKKIEHSITYNALVAVTLAENKGITRQFLHDSGVSVPRIVTPESADINYPVIARSKKHSYAQNFVALENYDTFKEHYGKHIKEGWYYAEYVNKVKEYRMNIGHGKVINVTEKVVKDNLSWNGFENGAYPTDIVPRDCDINVVKEALKAIKAVGLDFSGIDVMVDKNGKPYVLELNVSPGVSSSEVSASNFTRYIDWLGESDTVRTHFNVDSDRVEEYFWTFER